LEINPCGQLAPLLRGSDTLAKLFPQRSRAGAGSDLYKERADGLGAILKRNYLMSAGGLLMPREIRRRLICGISSRRRQ
jgi:hypothetical protein